MKRVLLATLCALLPIAGSVLAQVRIAAPSAAPAATPENLEFFEKRVRPLLLENCASCHSGNQPLGGFRLDPIADILKGGTHGPVLVGRDPEKSRLIRAIRHLPGVAAMPPSGKLSPDQITVLTEWVRRGAPLPAPAARKAANAKTSGGFPLELRRQHWAYRPMRRPAVPPVKNRAVIRNPIDAFLQARRESAGIRPAPPTDRRTLLRRVTYDLIGLPPTPAEINAFLADRSPNAYEKVVERLLASPHYGERWARHWLDLVRYAESLGHEFDYTIFNAWRYRDYVIRAFNADVPYDRFVTEHLAGDLLPDPRYDRVTGENESIQATGFFWLGEGKHSPVDVRQEQADRIDNQIDVIGKAFLAQTVACARCHDHKFDPIPTRDYYALYGILKSSRFQQAILDAPTRFNPVRSEIAAELRTVDRVELADRWKENLTRIDEKRLESLLPPGPTTEKPIAPINEWKGTGPAFAALARTGDLIVSRDAHHLPPTLIARPTAHSALHTRRFAGILRSPTFTIDRDYLHLRVAGKNTRVYIIVDNFLMIRDPLYGPLIQSVDDPRPHRRSVDLRRWKGHEAYIEVADSPVPHPGTIDAPVLPESAGQPSDAWIALHDAFLSDTDEPAVSAHPLTGLAPADRRQAMVAALERWVLRETAESDTPALELWDALLQAGLLDVSSLGPTIERVTALEATIPVPRLSLAMTEGTGRNERVFVRGSHRTRGEEAPRLRLAVCFNETDRTPTPTGSGRRELAARIASPRHPLTARVLVNRLWKHHFGVGIVPSVDDFGHMGEKPSHPELLDWLAGELVRQRWSIKRMHRLMVLSNTYRMSSRASDPVAERKDPKNVLLHRMSVRRPEAEVIRDSLLAVSGRLNRTLFGPGVAPFLQQQDGRGFPPTGPPDGDGRRTLYLQIRRNFPSLFLTAFDFPTPFTTIGRRSVSNVPAQALTMMNSDLVWQQAEFWAKRVLAERNGAPASAVIRSLYESAYGRPPTSVETAALLRYVEGRDDPEIWSQVCHALYNAKEFIYVF